MRKKKHDGSSANFLFSISLLFPNLLIHTLASQINHTKYPFYAACFTLAATLVQNVTDN